MNLVICNETLEPSPEGGRGFISPTGKLNDPGVEWGRSGWPNDGGKVPDSADLLQPPNVSDPVRIKSRDPVREGRANEFIFVANGVRS
jgi:hypothetical protein